MFLPLWLYTIKFAFIFIQTFINDFINILNTIYGNMSTNTLLLNHYVNIDFRWQE